MPVIGPVLSYFVTAVDWLPAVAVTTHTVTIALAPTVTEVIVHVPSTAEIVPVFAGYGVLFTATVTVSPVLISEPPEIFMPTLGQVQFTLKLPVLMPPVEASIGA